MEIDKNKIEEQIASLEASHAEEVQKLRDSLKPVRKPKVGDVYSFRGSKVILDGYNANIEINADGSPTKGSMTHAQIEEDREFEFIGKFSDVFFTKDQIEKMLLENLQTMRDGYGDFVDHWLPVVHEDVLEFISNLVQNKKPRWKRKELKLI